MPYKDPDKANENNRRWYARHKLEQQQRGRDKYHRDKEKYDIYRNLPEVKARDKAQKIIYNQLPRVKAKKRAYDRSEHGKIVKSLYQEKNKTEIAANKHQYYLDNMDYFLNSATEWYNQHKDTPEYKARKAENDLWWRKTLKFKHYQNEWKKLKKLKNSAPRIFILKRRLKKLAEELGIY
jgi:hypothetical protein